MFYSMLKKRAATNYQRTGGFVGMMGLFAVFAVLIVPPLAVFKIMDVPAYTAMRLIIPAVWAAYLIPGMLRLSERLHPLDALRLAVWPLRRA